jgi:hypothetical protein
MKLDFSETIKQLRAIEKQFNNPKDVGASNSFACLCAVELVAKELLRFVENYNNLFYKSVMDEFIRTHITKSALQKDTLLKGIKK